jgi:hypothetical protein
MKEQIHSDEIPLSSCSHSPGPFPNSQFLITQVRIPGIIPPESDSRSSKREKLVSFQDKISEALALHSMGLCLWEEVQEYPWREGGRR